MKTLLLCSLLLLLMSCTYASVGDATYLSVFQKKNGTLSYDPTTGSFHFEYSSDSDPAIEALKQGIALGVMAAKP